MTVAAGFHPRAISVDSFFFLKNYLGFVWIGGRSISPTANADLQLVQPAHACCAANSSSSDGRRDSL